MATKKKAVKKKSAVKKSAVKKKTKKKNGTVSTADAPSSGTGGDRPPGTPPNP